MPCVSLYWAKSAVFKKVQVEGVLLRLRSPEASPLRIHRGLDGEKSVVKGLLSLLFQVWVSESSLLRGRMLLQGGGSLLLRLRSPESSPLWCLCPRVPNERELKVLWCCERKQ